MTYKNATLRTFVDDHGRLVAQITDEDWAIFRRDMRKVAMVMDERGDNESAKTFLKIAETPL